VTIEQQALAILDTYDGANNYILKLKKKKIENRNFVPSTSQSEYIINFHKEIPKVARKWVDLDSYFAKKISEEKGYLNQIDRIWVEKLLAEKEKSYHMWGVFLSGETMHDFWIPKAAIIKTPETKKIEVDYSKYAHRPPLEHQKTAIETLAGTKKFILADQMGVGKSTSAVIGALESGAKKILIICPASLKINWQRELSYYTDKSIFICEGKNFSYDHDIIIMNYDIVKNFYDIKDKENSPIHKNGFDLLILDEAHYISNTAAARTKLINSFAKTIDKVWLLTGTPMTNRPINYYNLLDLIDSPVAKNWTAYVIRYCGGYQFKVNNRKIWNVNGASNLEELRDRTSKQMLRRLKTDVLDLPEKIITPIYLKLKSDKYEELLGEYQDWVKTRKDKVSLTVQINMLMKARQLLANEKVEHTIELAENILEQDKKVLIFTNFTDSLNKLVTHFGKKAVSIDGSTSSTQRQYVIDQFQTNDKIKVFVGNIIAAGAGITLTEAESVIFNDLSFVPAHHQQAEDRAHRYGQKNSVSIYYPIFYNTIDNTIYEMLNQKKNTIDTVMGDNLDESDFLAKLMNKINGDS
jgi:SWI/SNF-related matrix-associated actin-dependent regulator 1 of chromatin subfamily A